MTLPVSLSSYLPPSVVMLHENFDDLAFENRHLVIALRLVLVSHLDIIRHDDDANDLVLSSECVTLTE